MKPVILIVDDSLTVRMDLQEAFEAAGFGTIACATLEAARRAARDSRFDLAVLDVILPDGDGLTFLQELKAAPRTAACPVLLLSAEDEVRDRVLGLRTGADDYVGKPYDLAQVVARARDLARRDRTLPRARPLIVAIDDSPTFAQELRATLDAAGYDVAPARTGEEGLRLAAELRPDAVIVDQELPGLDGPDVIRRLRADAALRRTPCLLLTASDRREDELRALEAGADVFSQKHASPTMLLVKVAALLRTVREPGAGPGLTSLLAPKRVLAVDDSATFLGRLCDELRGEGYDVVATRAGTEALELLGTQPVDCILLDLLMPGLSGQETCRRIKAHPTWRNIPLIILTALDEGDAMIEGINAGADDYITKSGDFEILKARVRAQLRRRQFEDENRQIREQLHRRELEAMELQSVRDLSETRAGLIASLEAKNNELAEANAELRRAKDAVEIANRELESFSYSVSHDLRAPLRAIDGFSQLLRERLGDQADDDTRHYLQRISAGVERMGQLISDILALSRVTRAEFRAECVDLGALAHAIVAELRAAAPERAVEIGIAPDLTATGDRGLVRIALENLLGNAWKFTARTAAARIEFGRLTPAGPGGPPTFFVRDKGAGFDMAHADKLFGAFKRLHRAEDFAGTGIGLATVRRIVNRHGGRIWAEAAPDRGATFFFTLAADSTAA